MTTSPPSGATTRAKSRLGFWGSAPIPLRNPHPHRHQDVRRLHHRSPRQSTHHWRLLPEHSVRSGHHPGLHEPRDFVGDFPALGQQPARVTAQKTRAGAVQNRKRKAEAGKRHDGRRSSGESAHVQRPAAAIVQLHVVTNQE